MAARRHVGARQRDDAGAGPAARGATGIAHRRDPGQPVGANDGKRGPRGWDGAKKLSGRKRHLLVDTGGLVLRVVVHPANVADRDGARGVLDPMPTDFPDVEHVWLDAGYRGALIPWAKETLGLTLTVVPRPRTRVRVPVDQEPPPAPTGFPVLPRRWVVERTFAWLGRDRRLSKDYERLAATEEAWIFLAMTQLMVRRLAK